MAPLVSFFLICSCTAISDRLDELENRIAALESLCAQMNEDIAAMESIVSAQQAGDYITEVLPITEDGTVTGYEIHFAKQDPIVIRNGKDGAPGADGTDGADGYTPQIGVRMDDDGVCYWTLDGEWLLDGSGNRLRVYGSDGADGKDGVTPQLKIEDGYWFISYDGTTWEQLGQATGDPGKDGQDGVSGASSISIEEREDAVVFTLADGTVITIPKQSPLNIEFAEEDLVVMTANSSKDIRYTITGTSESVEIEVITSADIQAKAVPDAASPLTGVISIHTGPAIDEYTKAVILVADGTRVIMRTLAFEEAGLQVVDNTKKSVGAEGGEVTLEYLSNLDVEVIIPEAVGSWISEAPQTRALTPGTVTLLVSRNDGALRTATVTLRSTYGDLAIDYTIEQEAAPESDPDIITFNDPNFLNAILSKNPGVDTDGDGRISIAEAEACTYLDISESSISDMSEIKYFTNLTYLNCSDNQLTYLDVSHNAQLTFLGCFNNQLSQLDVSNNAKLTTLECSHNQLLQLDLNKNAQLKMLYCGANQLTQLDVSYYAQLTKLDCSSNQLTQLDVSHNAQLTFLGCLNNQLSQLDVSNNAQLTTLCCNSNQLTQLDVSNNAQLTRLECHFNQLTQLDINNNAQLKMLNCYGNQLTQLDVSNNVQLTELNCGNNQLTQLDVSNNAQLTRLECYFNQLTQLDVSHNAQLTGLSCNSNQLTQLDVSHNAQLTGLDCNSNQLTQLDVSNNAYLSYLVCHNNQLTTIDVNNNTLLEILYCYKNQLTYLDVSDNVQLDLLSCFDNRLTQLDVSHNAQLTELYCYDNQLTYLDVSNNMNLTNFMCWNNPLTKLVLAEQHKSTEWYEDVYSEYSSVLTFDAQ